MAEPSPLTFRAFAKEHLPAVEAALENALPAVDCAPEDLHRAMRHAMFPGGKRLRPMLALLGARASGGSLEAALRSAAALELLHTYSLVHDDLPAMDDDALRRGRPTCHVAFGEATAILAGDGLLTLAFELVADGGAAAVRALARAAGSQGMVGGQAADLAAEGDGGPRPDADGALEHVQWIHDRKTGALISASLEVGALAGAAGSTPVEPAMLDALRRFGALVGRAFQVADDCLDLTASAEDLGKNPGQDLAADKLTYPAILGLEGSQSLARELAEQAGSVAGEIVELRAKSCQDRAVLDADAALLQDVAHYTVTRSH